MPKKFNPETTQNRSPFLLGKEIGHGEHADVFRSKQDPHKLVKQLRIRETYSLWEDNDAEMVLEDYSEEKFRKHYQSALRLLQKYLNDFLPETQLVFGNTAAGRKTGYLITEEVIPEETENPKEKTEKLDEMLTAVIQMFLDQPTGPKFVPDIFGKEEFRYGHTNKNPIPKYYILDIYPVFEMTSTDLARNIHHLMDTFKPQLFPKTQKIMGLLGNA